MGSERSYTKCTLNDWPGVCVNIFIVFYLFRLRRRWRRCTVVSNAICHNNNIIRENAFLYRALDGGAMWRMCASVCQRPPLFVRTHFLLLFRFNDRLNLE